MGRPRRNKRDNVHSNKNITFLERRSLPVDTHECRAVIKETTFIPMRIYPSWDGRSLTVDTPECRAVIKRRSPHQTNKKTLQLSTN